MRKVIIALAVLAVAFVTMGIGPEVTNIRDAPIDCGIKSIQFRFNSVYKGDAVIVIEQYLNPFYPTWSRPGSVRPDREAASSASSMAPNPGGCVNPLTPAEGDRYAYYNPVDFTLRIEARHRLTDPWSILTRISNMEPGHTVVSAFVLPVNPNESLSSILADVPNNFGQFRFTYEPPRHRYQWNSITGLMERVNPLTLPSGYPTYPYSVSQSNAKADQVYGGSFAPVVVVDEENDTPLSDNPAIIARSILLTSIPVVPLPWSLFENEEYSLSRSVGIPIEASLLLTTLPFALGLMGALARVSDNPVGMAFAGSAPYIPLVLTGVLPLAVLIGMMTYVGALFLHLSSTSRRSNI